MTHITKDDALNIAGQCRATASSPLAKTIAVDGGSALLCELLLDAAKTIEALAAPVKEPLAILNHAHGVYAFRSVNLQGLPDGEYQVYTTPTRSSHPRCHHR